MVKKKTEGCFDIEREIFSWVFDIFCLARLYGKKLKQIKNHKTSSTFEGRMDIFIDVSGNYSAALTERHSPRRLNRVRKFFA